MDLRDLARRRLSQLIEDEQKRARFHIGLIRREDPPPSNDRVAQTIFDRWVKVATVEGGLTGAAGFAGVPLNFVLFTYFQVAMVVSIAEAYNISLTGEAGEEALLGVIGKAHGFDDLVRESPRILGEIAKAIALRHGLTAFGRLIPMVAAPISAFLNSREMRRTGNEALRRFGNVVMLG